MLDRLQERSFWTDLVPDLSISSHVESAARPRALARGAEALESLCERGYADLGVVVEAEMAARLAAAVETLERAGLPPSFALVYDEPWAALAAVRGALPAPLRDVEMLADGWVWSVRPGAGGWPAHRDHNEIVRRGGAPERFTVWIALRDIGPESSTVALVGRQHDPAYPERIDQPLTDTPATHHARGPAGSAFVWDANIIHWGTTHRGDTPRISISTTMCTRALQPSAAIAITREPRFGLPERLDAIAYSMLRYRRYEPLSPELRRWARNWCAFGRIAQGLRPPSAS